MIPVVDMGSFLDRIENQVALASELGEKHFYADVVFAPPRTEVGKQLVESLESLDEQSGEKRDFYFPGYGRGPFPEGLPAPATIEGSDWWFSQSGYTRFAQSLRERFPQLRISGDPSFVILEISVYDESSVFARKMHQQFLPSETSLLTVVSEVDHTKRDHGVLRGRLVEFGLVKNKVGPLAVGSGLTLLGALARSLSGG